MQYVILYDSQPATVCLALQYDFVMIKYIISIILYHLYFDCQVSDAELVRGVELVVISQDLTERDTSCRRATNHHHHQELHQRQHRMEHLAV